MTPQELAGKLDALEPFVFGHMIGSAVIPWNKTPAYARAARGSIGRVCSGMGAYLVAPGGQDMLPKLGELDPAPAMAMALGEASYVIRSYGTPIVWWLGPEVYPRGEPKWIEVAERCNREYGRFSSTTSRHQNLVHAALMLLEDDDEQDGEQS